MVVKSKGINKYSKFLLLRPLLGLSKSGLISGMVLILIEEESKCPQIWNTLFHALFCLFISMQLFLKVLREMVNSVDPY